MSGRRVESRTYAPSDGLRGLVQQYWTGRWDLRGQPPHVTELLANPCVNLVFEAGGAHAGARLVGVWTRLWRRTLEDRGLVRGVMLRPGAARAFVNVPMVQLANRIVPLGELFGPAVSQLTHAILTPEDDAPAFGALEAWLLSRRLPTEDPQVGLAIALLDRIARDPDIATVEQLAVVAGMGPRALQRLFRDYVGASPKWSIRRNRLQEAALRIERGEGPTLAAIAAELHYADQAHLARDFKSAVGKSPREFSMSVHR